MCIPNVLPEHSSTVQYSTVQYSTVEHKYRPPARSLCNPVKIIYNAYIYSTKSRKNDDYSRVAPCCYVYLSLFLGVVTATANLESCNLLILVLQLCSFLIFIVKFESYIISLKNSFEQNQEIHANSPSH